MKKKNALYFNFCILKRNSNNHYFFCFLIPVSERKIKWPKDTRTFNEPVCGGTFPVTFLSCTVNEAIRAKKYFKLLFFFFKCSNEGGESSESGTTLLTECTQRWHTVQERNKWRTYEMSTGNKQIVTSSSVKHPPLTLQTSQTTHLCLSQECVGQLDLGVVRNIKVLTSLWQGDIKLLLEPEIDGWQRKKGRRGEKKGIINVKTRDLDIDVQMYSFHTSPRAGN